MSTTGTSRVSRALFADQGGATSPFFWSGNNPVSASDVKRTRSVAEALFAQNNKIASNGWEGLAQLARAYSGSVLNDRASEAEQAGQASVAELLSGLGPDADMNSIMAVMGNEWASPQQQAIAQALFADALRRSDPLYQQNLERGSIELEAMRNPAVDPWAGTKVVNDQVLGMGGAGPEVLGDFRTLEAPSPGGEMFDVEGKLRGEYQGGQGYKDFIQQEQAYQRVLDSARDAGDLALIFNYMKVLDPGSVVRESEFATAAASGSFGDRLQAAADQILSGKRLSPEQRRDFVQRAGDMFSGASGLYGGMNDRYSTLAGEYGIDPSRIIRPGAQIGVMSPDFSIDDFLGAGGAAPISQADPTIFGGNPDDPLGLR